MTDDLPDRLRHEADSNVDNSELHREAADEIDRRRAENEVLRAQRDYLRSEAAQQYDWIDRLSTAGTALLNAKTADQVIEAEAEWHRLMGWADD